LSLDITLYKRKDVFEYNITHNLTTMADAVKIDNKTTLHQYLWRPDELGITTAKELIKPLKIGLKKLKAKPDKYKAFNPENGWGNYENLVTFVEKYLDACEWNEECLIEISR